MDKSADPTSLTAAAHQLDIPDWLTPVHSSATLDVSPAHRELVAQGNRARREIDEMRFERILDRVLERVAMGNPLTEALGDEVYDIDYATYLRWLLKDEDRKRRYYEAQEMGAEIVSHQMIKIADADDSIEDVARSTLRINTRKWLLGVWNRKRFGDIKQIEQNVSINLGEAMQQAQARVEAARVVDVQARVIK